MNDLRAPRLTDMRLDDLTEALITLDDQLAYLDAAIDGGLLSAGLLNTFREKRERLRRAREWIAGKVSAERARREPA